MTTMETQPENNAEISDNINGLFTLSEDPYQAIHDMMKTIDDLREIYVEENKALNSADTKLFVSLQQRKIDAACHYRAGSQQIIKRSEEFKKLDPALRKQLVEKQQEFSALANTNIEALSRMRGTLGKLNERILGAARKAVVKNNINYGRKGDINEDGGPTSLGLNESA
jgi:hypothetical protein